MRGVDVNERDASTVLRIMGSTLISSGSAAVDGPLHEMLDNVVRDYINTWYNKISTNQQVRMACLIIQLG